MKNSILLTLDDYGLYPMTADNNLALLNILEVRYNRKDLFIASQFPVSIGYEFIENAPLADAIMNRLIAKSIQVKL